MSLDIQHSSDASGRAQLALAGQLDGATHGELDRVITRLLDDPALNTLVLDLAGLDYISSAGLRSIFRARKALGPRDGRVLVVNPQPQVEKVFDIVKAVPMREIFRSVEEMDLYLDRIQARVLDPDAD
jgi:anti-anti-sigma factor